jgi:hypothetical protein
MQQNRGNSMIDAGTVIKSYTGRQGCMCGCQGTYRVASQYFEKAGAERGYAYDQSDISDRSVVGTVNRLNRLIDWSDPEAVAQHVTSDHAWFDTPNGRTLVVYFAQ